MNILNHHIFMNSVSSGSLPFKPIAKATVTGNANSNKVVFFFNAMLILACCLLTFQRSSLESRNLTLPQQMLYSWLQKCQDQKGGIFNSIQFAQVDTKDVLLFKWQEHLIQRSCTTSCLKKGSHCALQISFWKFRRSV